MTNTKKLIYGFLAGIAVIILVTSLIPGLGSDDSVKITDLDYTAIVEDDEGKALISERLTFDINADSEDSYIWELWRDLPETYVDGVKIQYTVKSVKEILADGSVLVYEESDKLYWWDEDYVGYNGLYGPGKWFHSKGPYDGEYNFECVLFYVDGLYDGSVTFEIEYEMTNAALRYGNASEFYVSIFSGDAVNNLESLKAQFLFPLDIMPQAGNYDAYTYGTNSHAFPFTESDTVNPGYHTFSFELNQDDLQFKSYNKYIEFALISYGEDKHIFTQNASVNDYYELDMLSNIRSAQDEYEALPAKWDQIKKTTLIASSIGSVVAVLVAYGIVMLVKKSIRLYKPAMKIDYFRDIPSPLDANFARRLVFSKKGKVDDFGDGYAAAMLSLVHKGYIDIEQVTANKSWASENVRFIVKPEPVQQRESLTPIEERYYNLIVRHAGIGGQITHNSFEQKILDDYEHTDSFVKGVKASLDKMGLSSGYFQKVKFKGPKHIMTGFAVVYLVIGILTMTTANIGASYTRLDLAYGAFFILGGGFILGAIIMLVVSKDFILLTQTGQDEYEKWRGLYKFLDSETLMKERGVLEVHIWEQYLIYATAFGISEKVIKALKVRCPEDVMNQSTMLRTPYFRSSYFYYHSRSSFRTTTGTASFASRSGGHAGYGGGGRGGGGGGGGH